MKSKLILTHIVCATLLFFAASAWTAARADLYVIESTAAGITPGTYLRSNDNVTIQAGSYIRAVLPSGKTQSIRGPYTGTVANLGKGQGENAGVLAWLRNILQTGGATEATPGATRSLGKEQPKPLKVGFSWTIVPATMTGTVCIQKGGNLQLARAPSSQAERVVVLDVVKSQQGEAQFSAGSDVTAWPSTIQPRADGIYYMSVESQPRRQVTLRVLDQLPTEEDVLAELQRLGCKYQFETYVREKLAAAKRS
jgi:hypothetical protein